jgi:hypothetical protein
MYENINRSANENVQRQCGMSNETNEKLSALFLGIFDVYSLLPLSRMTSVFEPNHFNNILIVCGDSETVQTSEHRKAVECNSVLRVGLVYRARRCHECFPPVVD